MKKFFFLLTIIGGVSFSTSTKALELPGGEPCCFNTVLPGYVCFTYTVVEVDGSSHKEGVPGIRIPCPSV
jgi:hypothetical protein